MKLAGSPSSTVTAAGARDTVTAPGSVIVVVAFAAVPSTAAPPPPVTPVRVTESVSFGSSSAGDSASVATVIVPVATPAAMVSDPVGAV